VDAPHNSETRARSIRRLRWALIAAVVLYAFLAGLRTVGDFDAGWQLAMGRYVVQHHAVPSTDVLSYTAQGQPWIYPPFAGVLLYLIFAKFSWAGLSWICALFAAAVACLVTRRAGVATAALALKAVPLIADRATPRADLFTLLLFPLFLIALLRARESDDAPLWPLPIIMLFWVNLHPGFVMGLALMIWFIAVELTERRWSRLRSRWPWLAATFLVTLVNPWGPKIYLAIARQEVAMRLHAAFIGEWSAARWSLGALFGAAGPLPATVELMICAGVLGALLAIYRRAFFEAALLIAAAYESLRHLRLQAVCAVVIVIIVGKMLDETYDAWSDAASAGRLKRAALPVALMLLAAISIAELVSNRYYVMAASTSQLGPGESWWFPERAADFIMREQLPRQLLHEYNAGGFVAVKLGPQYPDYIDGRAIPFGTAMLLDLGQLLRQPPDSAAWSREADQRGVNVLLFSLARFGGLGNVDVAGFCRSQNWRPVYLDEVSIVLLRNTPQSRPWIDRLQVDCATQKFSPPQNASRMQLFNFYSNAASVLYVLSRDQESFADLQQAQQLYPYDPNVHLTRGQLFASEGRLPDAEAEFRSALNRKQTDTAWFSLGGVLASEGRLQESREAMKNAAKYSAHPENAFKAMGQLSVALKEPDEALRDFDRAESTSPYRGEAEALGTEFLALLDQGRAAAWREKNDLAKTIEFQQRAVQRTPNAQKRWVDLARLYEAAGRPAEAAQAMEHARGIGPH
jgi:tetratricopeptide (TPR) repeat protein